MARDRRPMPGRFDGKRLEPDLPDMAAALIVPVILPRGRRHEVAERPVVVLLVEHLHLPIAPIEHMVTDPAHALALAVLSMPDLYDQSLLQAPKK